MTIKIFRDSNESFEGSKITLRKALSVLSKSSPFSVKTATERNEDVYDKVKNYLFIEQEIEEEFKNLLGSLSDNEIVFLCGSSGDGKSEILSRFYQKYRMKYHFHLDATHSFAPSQSAIQALDEVFDRSKEDGKPLIVGINIGMLANFTKEGAERHDDIKEFAEVFLSEGVSSRAGYYFLDFEKYPKFDLSKKDGTYSSFTKELMGRLCRPDEGNPFFCYAKQDENVGRDLRLVANYNMLSCDSVQEAIITYLFKARLMRDQFVTTRALLDFLHHLLVGDGHLYDNLYGGSDNELVQRMAEFDPARKHTKKIDQFILRYELALPEPSLDEFIKELAKKHIWFDRESPKEGDAASLIRLFALLRSEAVGNNYHHEFRSEFNESLLDEYASVWALHKGFDGTNLLKVKLRNFYVNEFISAICLYANRNVPELLAAKDVIFLGQFGTVTLAANIEIKADYDRILKSYEEKSAHFFAFLKVSDKSLGPITIKLNLLELIFKLNRGYRPNKYDKNAVVLLDELVERIRDIAKTSTSLLFYEGEKCYVAKQDDGMIAISGGL